MLPDRESKLEKPGRWKFLNKGRNVAIEAAEMPRPASIMSQIRIMGKEYKVSFAFRIATMYIKRTMVAELALRSIVSYRGNGRESRLYKTPNPRIKNKDTLIAHDIFTFHNIGTGISANSQSKKISIAVNAYATFAIEAG